MIEEIRKLTPATVDAIRRLALRLDAEHEAWLEVEGGRVALRGKPAPDLLREVARLRRAVLTVFRAAEAAERTRESTAGWATAGADAAGRRGDAHREVEIDSAGRTVARSAWVKL